eukprot:7296808-Prymnesium_polylepis.1
MTAHRQRGCELKGKRVCKQRGYSKRSVRPQRSPQTSRRTTAAGGATDSVATSRLDPVTQSCA